MKDLIISLLFLVIFITFGIMSYYIEILSSRITELESKIVSCETAIIRGTKIDDIQFSIMDKIISKLDQKKQSMYINAGPLSN